MMTRRALARQEESNLQLTLQRLKATTEENEQLHRERDDNEKELIDVLARNSKLKNEMAELHAKFLDAIGERDQLQVIVDGFDNCSDAYEQALSRIAELKIQLHEANNIISSFETQQANLTASHNQSLFDELVGHAPRIVSAGFNPNTSLTNDVTGEDTYLPTSSHNKRIKCSKNKLKKYIKINNFIKKTNKLVNKQKLVNRNIKSSKERVDFINQLNAYTLTLENNQSSYESDINKLNIDIENLQKSLQFMSSRYDVTNKQAREQVLVIDELLYNNELLESLTRNHKCVCNCSQKESELVCEPVATQKLPQEICNQNMSSSNTKSTSSFKLNNVNNKIVMFSDDLGKGMGRLISNELGQTITNYCLPGLSFSQIVQKLIKHNFTPDTTLFRYKFNLTLDMLICNNRNKYHLVDINNYIKSHYSTNNIISMYYKRQLAISLSYYFIQSAKNLVNQTASIEQSKCVVNSQALEYVPNHLN